MEIRTGTVIVASIIAAGMFVFVGCEAAGIPHDKGKSNFSAVKSMGTWYEQGPRRARIRIKDGYLDYDITNTPVASSISSSPSIRFSLVRE